METVISVALAIAFVWVFATVVMSFLSGAKDYADRTGEDLDVSVDGRPVRIVRGADMVSAECRSTLDSARCIEFRSGRSRGAFSMRRFVTGDPGLDQAVEFASVEPARALAALSSDRRESLRTLVVGTCGLLGNTAYLSLDSVDFDIRMRHEQVAPFFRLVASMHEWIDEVDDVPANLLSLMLTDPEFGVRWEALMKLAESGSKSSGFDLLAEDVARTTVIELLRSHTATGDTFAAFLELLPTSQPLPSDLSAAIRARITDTQGFIAGNMLQAIAHANIGFTPAELESMIVDGEASTAAAAFTQVRYLAQADALPLITLGFKRYSPMVWPAAVKGLVERGTPEALATARELLADDSPDEARREALQALLTQSGQTGGLAVIAEGGTGGELSVDESAVPR